MPECARVSNYVRGLWAVDRYGHYANRTRSSGSTKKITLTNILYFIALQHGSSAANEIENQ